jgi:hypothetical protein
MRASLLVWNLRPKFCWKVVESEVCWIGSERESGENSVNTDCQGDKTGFEPPLDRL